jgi:hypothetical protein
MNSTADLKNIHLRLISIFAMLDEWCEENAATQESQQHDVIVDFLSAYKTFLKRIGGALSPAFVQDFSEELVRDHFRHPLFVRKEVRDQLYISLCLIEMLSEKPEASITEMTEAFSRATQDADDCLKKLKKHNPIADNQR